MKVDGLFGVCDIASTGMNAEWYRMKVIANNIANADTVQTPEGGPFRRQVVVFSTRQDELAGVAVKGIERTSTPPRIVYEPGNPLADERGYVAYPNVSLPEEMVDMMEAMRSYEANLVVVRRFKRLCEEALDVLR